MAPVLNQNMSATKCNKKKKSKLSKQMQRSILYKQTKKISWGCHFLGHLFCKSGKDGAKLIFALRFCCSLEALYLMFVKKENMKIYISPRS